MLVRNNAVKRFSIILSTTHSLACWPFSLFFSNPLYKGINKYTRNPGIVHIGQPRCPFFTRAANATRHQVASRTTKGI